MITVTLNRSASVGTIHPEIYGHFSEHIGGVFYDGLWVGEDSPVRNIRGFRADLVESLKRIHPPVLRWPGGCFAETYDWRDGIGPREKRPRRAGWWYPYDHRVESNAVGTHEFVDLCNMIGAEPYFAANMTSLTPQHIRNWVEYCNFPEGSTTLAKERAQNGHSGPMNVRYWGIGNENWGGGGQMTPEMCAREFIRYTTILNSLDRGQYRFILCGPNGDDARWTERLMREWAARTWQEAPTWGLSVHYYTGDSEINPNHPDFDEKAWYDTLIKANRMGEVIDMHRRVMDEFDPQRGVGIVVDEWGCWHREGTGPSRGYNLFEQQSNMLDACVCALTLNAFNNRADVVSMANVAQLVNNLHSLYLAGGEHFVETVNYHVFDMFAPHQGARQIAAVSDAEELDFGERGRLPAVSVSASERDGCVLVTMANLRLDAGARVRLKMKDAALSGDAEIRTLSHGNPTTCNTFEQPMAVVPHANTISLKEGAEIVIPAAGVVSVRFQTANSTSK